MSISFSKTAAIPLLVLSVACGSSDSEGNLSADEPAPSPDGAQQNEATTPAAETPPQKPKIEVFGLVSHDEETKEAFKPQKPFGAADGEEIPTLFYCYDVGRTTAIILEGTGKDLRVELKSDEWTAIADIDTHKELGELSGSVTLRGTGFLPPGQGDFFSNHHMTPYTVEVFASDDLIFKGQVTSEGCT